MIWIRQRNARNEKSERTINHNRTTSLIEWNSFPTAHDVPAQNFSVSMFEREKKQKINWKTSIILCNIQWKYNKNLMKFRENEKKRNDTNGNRNRNIRLFSLKINILICGEHFSHMQWHTHVNLNNINLRHSFMHSLVAFFFGKSSVRFHEISLSKILSDGTFYFRGKLIMALWIHAPKFQFWILLCTLWNEIAWITYTSIGVLFFG